MEGGGGQTLDVVATYIAGIRVKGEEQTNREMAVGGRCRGIEVRPRREQSTLPRLHEQTDGQALEASRSASRHSQRIGSWQDSKRNT